MSEDSQHNGSATAPGQAAQEASALPVLAPEATVVRDSTPGAQLERSRAGASLPAVQAAAAAAGGFVAGAAVVGLVARRQRRAAPPAKRRRAVRRPGRGRKAAPSAGELVQIVGSRSLLVDVHLLGGR
jgi:hypothetical protein